MPEKKNEYLLTFLLRKEKVKSFLLLCPHMVEYTEEEKIVYKCKGKFTDKIKRKLERQCSDVDNDGLFNYQRIISAKIIKIEKIGINNQTKG